MKKPFQTYPADRQNFNRKRVLRHFLRQRRMLVWLGSEANCIKKQLTIIKI